MTIALVDTSVFCNYLKVPGRDQDAEAIIEKYEFYVSEKVNLLLPIATILETGNHIAHIPNGQARRQTAIHFTNEVQKALDSKFPWAVPQPLLEPETLRQYLADFPDRAMRGISLGDLSIIQEYERQCDLHRDRRIFIWSLDADLRGYDRPAKL